jgi:hypothetical protein
LTPFLLQFHSIQRNKRYLFLPIGLPSAILFADGRKGGGKKNYLVWFSEAFGGFININITDLIFSRYKKERISAAEKKFDKGLSVLYARKVLATVPAVQCVHVTVGRTKSERSPFLSQNF